jgi:phosphatidylglycerol---prolipoprotein diacylglyceryl transferase
VGCALRAVYSADFKRKSINRGNSLHPIAFNLGSRPIYWYGIMMALAFLAAMIHWAVLGRRERRPAGFWSDLAFWIMIGTIVGARLGYILGNLEYFAENPAHIIRVDEGGLVFYGGLLGCVLVVILLARRQREPLWSLADFAVSALPLGHAIGRIGCFLNGCCYGSECAGPLAVEMAGALRHPVQLYCVLLNLALYAFLLWLYPRKRRDGDVLAAYCLIYPVMRFLIEFMRGDPRVAYLGLTSAQWVSLAIFACGLLLLKFLPAKLFRNTRQAAER